MEPEYDSRIDTEEHINKVRENIAAVIANMATRGSVHDASKLEEPEKSAFDKTTPSLKGHAYGSKEYRATLREIQPALQHHYSVNDHHPEFHEYGMREMSLMAILEMVCDWRAAAQRHDPPTPFAKSLQINTERFQIPASLANIISKTAHELGW